MDALSNLKSVWKASKNAILNIPEIEQKVMEATNNEKWGPTGQQMNEIAKATYSYNDFPVIMEVIWKRLAERVPTDWRHVYKSLLLLEHLLRNGSDQVITETRVHVYALERLSSYTSFEEGKDNGLSVRERAKAVLELVTDERRLRDEREKALANRKKFQSGISSEDYRGGYGGGYGNNSYPSYEDPYGDNGAPKATNFDYNFSSNNSPQYNQTSQPPPIASISSPPVSNSPSIFDATGEESSSSDSDDDFIPREAAQAASRPRAPSGGSSTPKVQDLLGLNFSSPSPSPSPSPSNFSSSNSNSSSFNAQFTAQFDQQSVQSQPQPQPLPSSVPSSSFDFFSSQPQQSPQQPPQQPPQVQSSMLSFAPVQSQPQTPSPQLQSPAKPSSPSPSSPSVDDKDPWKKAANLFDLDSITDEISKPKTENYSTTPQGYGNIRQLQGQNPYNAMNNNMNNNMNNSMNNNMGRGAPMANYNQFANPQFGNPQFANPQFANPQFGNPQFGNPQFANPQFANPQFANPQFANPQFANPQFANPQFANMGNMNMNMNGMNNMGSGAPSNPNAFW